MGHKRLGINWVWSVQSSPLNVLNKILSIKKFALQICFTFIHQFFITGNIIAYRFTHQANSL